MKIERNIATLRHRRIGQVTGRDRAAALALIIQHAAELAPFVEGGCGGRTLAVVVENWVMGGVPPQEIVRAVLRPGVLLIVHRHTPDFIGTGRLAEILRGAAKLKHCWVLVDSEADAGLAELNPQPNPA